MDKALGYEPRDSRFEFWAVHQKRNDMFEWFLKASLQKSVQLSHSWLRLRAALLGCSAASHGHRRRRQPTRFAPSGPAHTAALQVALLLHASRRATHVTCMRPVRAVLLLVGCRADMLRRLVPGLRRAATKTMSTKPRCVLLNRLSWRQNCLFYVTIL